MDVKEHPAHNIPQATEHYDSKVFAIHDLSNVMLASPILGTKDKQMKQSQEISDYVPRSDIPGSEEN